jgi:hypothetical protein
VLDSHRESDCIVKYIIEEYEPTAVTNFAIGLKSTDFAGPRIYEWDYTDNQNQTTHDDDDAATPSFTNWCVTTLSRSLF